MVIYLHLFIYYYYLFIYLFIYIYIYLFPETPGYNKPLLIMTTYIAEEHYQFFIIRIPQSRKKFCECTDTLEL